MTKETFLAALARTPEPFSSDGASCHLRHIMAGEWPAWEAIKEQHADASFANWLFVRSVCDESGTRLFEDSDAESVDGFPLGVVNAICKRVQEMNGMEGAEGKASSTTGLALSSTSN